MNESSRKTERLTAAVTPERVLQCRQMCALSGVSVSALLDRIIGEEFERHGSSGDGMWDTDRQAQIGQTVDHLRAAIAKAEAM